MDSPFSVATTEQRDVAWEFVIKFSECGKSDEVKKLMGMLDGKGKVFTATKLDRMTACIQEAKEWLEWLDEAYADFAWVLVVNSTPQPNSDTQHPTPPPFHPSLMETIHEFVTIENGGPRRQALHSFTTALEGLEVLKTQAQARLESGKSSKQPIHPALQATLHHALDQRVKLGTFLQRSAQMFEDERLSDEEWEM